MEWTHINEGLPKVPGGIPDTCNIRVLAIIKEEVIPDHIDQPNWRYDIKVVKYNRKYGFSEDVVYWTYISNVPELEHLPIKLKNISNKEDLRIKIEIDNGVGAIDTHFYNELRNKTVKYNNAIFVCELPSISLILRMSRLLPM